MNLPIAAQVFGKDASSHCHQQQKPVLPLSTCLEAGAEAGAGAGGGSPLIMGSGWGVSGCNSDCE